MRNVFFIFFKIKNEYSLNKFIKLILYMYVCMCDNRKQLTSSFKTSLINECDVSVFLLLGENL
jgi:hypothetical protein